MSSSETKAPRLPPRWFIRGAWRVHRAIYSVTRGRIGLWGSTPKRWGTMRLTTVGRRSGKERRAILGYFDDGSNLVTLAMNGWGEAEPNWWINLQAHPDATVEVAGEARAVRGRAAVAEERARLWTRWREYDPNLDGYARMRSGETAVVVLEPRTGDAATRR